MTVRPCPACQASDARTLGDKDSYRLVRCKRCATLYTAEAVQGAYDDYYDDANLEVPAFIAGRIDEIVGGFDSCRRTNRLLDVGFGAGTFLQAARRAGWNVAGVEVSLPAIEQARRDGFDVFHGTLQDAAYAEASFDVVVATEIFEHLVSVRPLLDEIARVLRPGGLLWATTPNARGLSARVLGKAWSVVSPPEHLQLFSIAGVRSLLGAAGFRDASVLAEGVNPYELLDRFRGRRVRRVASGYELISYLSRSRSRRALKRLVNRVLSLLLLGDSLKISAHRCRTPAPEPAPPPAE